LMMCSVVGVVLQFKRGICVLLIPVTPRRSLLIGRKKMFSSRVAHLAAVVAFGRTWTTGVVLVAFFELPQPATSAATNRRRNTRFITFLRRAPAANVRGDRARSRPRGACLPAGRARR